MKAAIRQRSGKMARTLMVAVLIGSWIQRVSIIWIGRCRSVLLPLKTNVVDVKSECTRNVQLRRRRALIFQCTLVLGQRHLQGLSVGRTHGRPLT